VSAMDAFGDNNSSFGSNKSTFGSNKSTFGSNNSMIGSDKGTISNEAQSQINSHQDRNFGNHNSYNNYDNGYKMGSGNENYRPQHPHTPQHFSPHNQQQIYTESSVNKLGSQNKASDNSKFNFISKSSEFMKPPTETQNYRDLKSDINHVNKGKEVSGDSFSFLNVLKSSSSVSSKNI
jgi:hypothetical protein